MSGVPAQVVIPRAIRTAAKVELPQHVDGSIPAATTWRMLQRHGLHPVADLAAMRRRLELQQDEEGSLLAWGGVAGSAHRGWAARLHGDADGSTPTLSPSVELGSVDGMIETLSLASTPEGDVLVAWHEVTAGDAHDLRLVRVSADLSTVTEP